MDIKHVEYHVNILRLEVLELLKDTDLLPSHSDGLILLFGTGLVIVIIDVNDLESYIAFSLFVVPTKVNVSKENTD